LASTWRERGRERKREKERERERKGEKKRERDREKQREKQKQRFRESHRKIEIFVFVKITPISKSHKLQYGTYAIYVPHIISGTAIRRGGHGHSVKFQNSNLHCFFQPWKVIAFGKHATKPTHTQFEINIFTYGKAAMN
jgi:hypothetical protein